MPDVKGAADKGKGALTHKVGPLPLWGWAVAGVATMLVVRKFTGGSRGSSAGAGSFAIPNLGSGAPAGSVATGGNAPVVSPSQNAAGGADTAVGSAAPPWWANPLNWSQATPSVPLTGQPSSNGSAGAGPATTTPTGAAPPAATAPSWWQRLINPAGSLPSGAAVTTIGGTSYSLSSDALGRAGITGASAPTAPAAPPASQTASAPTGWVSQWGGVGAGPFVPGGSAAPSAPPSVGSRAWINENR